MLDKLRLYRWIIPEKKSDDLIQISLIHFQMINAPQIQNLKDTFVGKHSIDLQISAAEVQEPRALLNFITEESDKLLCSQGIIEGNIHWFLELAQPQTWNYQSQGIWHEAECFLS